MTETPAKGVRGFLLYNPFSERHFFRIYDPNDKSKFKDYRVAAEEIEVEILSNCLVLYDYKDGEKGRLDWDSRVLGR